MLHNKLPSKEVGILRGQVLQQVQVGMRSKLHVAEVAALQVLVRPACQPPGGLQAMSSFGIMCLHGGYVHACNRSGADQYML